MIDTIALALNKRNLTWKVKVDGLNHDKQPYSWLEEKKKRNGAISYFYTRGHSDCRHSGCIAT